VFQGSSEYCNDQYGADDTIKQYSPELTFRKLLAASMMSDVCTAAAADETSVLGKYLTCQSTGAVAACALREAMSQCGAFVSVIRMYPYPTSQSLLLLFDLDTNFLA
jgi:hypothetical protein